MQTYDGMMVKG